MHSFVSCEMSVEDVYPHSCQLGLLLLVLFSSRAELTDDKQSNLELEVLQRNHSILNRAISADDILPSLFAERLVTFAQMEDIYSHTSGGARNTALLTALRRQIFPLHPFCRILSNTPGQEDLAKKLLQGK